MTRRLPIMLLVCALALTLFAACGSSSDGGDGGSSAKCPSKVDTRTAENGEITVCASDIKFDVVTINAKPGPLKVTMENDGAIYHTMKIKDTDLELKANAGKSDSGTVTLEKGTYDFECTVPGHATNGMKGKIVVA